MLGLVILFAMAFIQGQVEKPFLFAGIYAALILCIQLMFGSGVVGGLIAAVLAFVFAAGYFYMLNMVRDKLVLWIVVLIAGPVIWMVITVVVLAAIMVATGAVPTS